MRLLLIAASPALEALIRQQVALRWPGAELRLWSPVHQGEIPPEFLAQGFDAVLLTERWSGGEGLDWLRELGARPGFAKLVFIAEGPGATLCRTAMASGAVAVLDAANIDHEAWIGSLNGAATAQRAAMGDWRVSADARDARRFGDAYIPGYRRARVLARGSVSQLYIAESEKAGALVALKVTASQRDASGVDQSFDRFLQEYEIAGRLQHPNIVRLHELGVADDHAYLAMEYFPLGDLRRRMRSGLSPAESLAIAAQLARVLASIHAAGIVHRDLKPGNVMMRADEQIALIDFGLAKQLALDLDLTDRGLIFGTPHYMSPEQGHGQSVDARSDLYSLGVLLFEMLTGRKPYTADNPMAVLYLHRHGPMPMLSEPVRQLEPLVHRLMAKLPSDRYADATEAAAAINLAREAWLAGYMCA
jgi:hypothetical protein